MNWDTYFMNIAEAVSKKSHCFSIQRGCVLVKDKQILSTGYNGPPMGFPHCEHLFILPVDKELLPLDVPQYTCPRKRVGFKSGEGLEYCPASHAELNAIVSAARNGISVKGATLYLNFDTSPCRECAKAIVNSGIVEAVVKSDADKPYDFKGLTGLFILKACGISLRNAEGSV